MLALEIHRTCWADLFRRDGVTDVTLGRITLEAIYGHRSVMLKVEGGLPAPPVGMASLLVELSPGATMRLLDAQGYHIGSVKLMRILEGSCKLAFDFDRSIEIVRSDAGEKHLARAQALAAAASAGRRVAGGEGGWRP